MPPPVQSRPRRVTQAEVARLAGCSQNTVALALRNSSRISRERRERIHKLAKQLGYRPNIAARNLVSQRSGLIGVFTGPLDEVRTQLVGHLLSTLHGTQYRPVLGMDESRPSPWYNAPWIESFRDFQVEAMVPIAWTDEVHLPPWYREIPLIMVAIQPDPTLPCDYVGLDRIEAGRQATEYLLRKGHRRIVALADTQRRYVVQGYAQTMREAGLVTDFSVISNMRFPGFDAEVRAFVERCRSADRPTAAVVVNSRVALHLCDALQSVGLRVPQDLAIIGYDRLPMADFLRLPITALEQPVSQLAEQTVKLTQERLADAEAPPKHIVLKHELVIRASA